MTPSYIPSGRSSARPTSRGIREYEENERYGRGYRSTRGRGSEREPYLREEDEKEVETEDWEIGMARGCQFPAPGQSGFDFLMERRERVLSKGTR